YHIVRALSRNQSEIQIGQLRQLSAEKLPNEILVDPHLVMVQLHSHVRQPLALGEQVSLAYATQAIKSARSVHCPVGTLTKQGDNPSRD
ncbi:MAG TPA: hypothetical protein VJ301_06170, partial [Propionibacteriaceae bacterium]|nr:hypothetical protein [Propionibacteriaceae bacterium]